VDRSRPGSRAADQDRRGRAGIHRVRQDCCARRRSPRPVATRTRSSLSTFEALVLSPPKLRCCACCQPPAQTDQCLRSDDRDGTQRARTEARGPDERQPARIGHSHGSRRPPVHSFN
jgi:hypothetical protein